MGAIQIGWFTIFAAIMIIHQFYDKGLAHASYAVVRGGKMVVIDPGRDPQPYYDFALLHEADITGVIETHPHADFVSSHSEIHQTSGATIYASRLTGAAYPHESFDEGDTIELGDLKLKALNTPGHSPDSICVLLRDEYGHDKAIFTGDTLFVGDVGRPDLREAAGNITAKRDELAAQLYHSTRDKLMRLPRHVIVYPAHGPGSLCGKNISAELQSTIGREMRENYALQQMDEQQFISLLNTDQPFVPKYFGYNVELNKTGAQPLYKAISSVPKTNYPIALEPNIAVIDSRPNDLFIKGHVQGAINLQNGEKFESWLGAVIGPDEKFYLITVDDTELDMVIKKTAKIGYECNIKAAIAYNNDAGEASAQLDMEDFKLHMDNYQVIDVRNKGEINAGMLFDSAIAIPLHELRERLGEIPAGKPVVVHCAAGYRSAAAASIIAGTIRSVPVYDLGEAVLGIATTSSAIS